MTTLTLRLTLIRHATRPLVRPRGAQRPLSKLLRIFRGPAILVVSFFVAEQASQSRHSSVVQGDRDISHDDASQPDDPARAMLYAFSL